MIPVGNFFLFTPIIIKLNTQNLHESRMCPIDFGVKWLEVNVTIHWLLKMVLTHKCFLVTTTIMKRHTQT